MHDLRGKNRVRELISVLIRLDPDAFVWTSCFDGDVDLCVGQPWGEFESILIDEVSEYQLDDESELEELKEDWTQNEPTTEV